MTRQRSAWRPSEPAETAYHRARQEWDRRMGAATVQAAHWRLATFALIGLQLVADVGLIVFGLRPKAVPHIIEVDKLGQPVYLGPAGPSGSGEFRPSAASIQYHLSRFITDTREITSDLALLKRNWLDAYRLVTSNGASFLNGFVHQHNPFEIARAEVRVSLEVNVAVPITKESWQVDWTETTWDDHGDPTQTAAWRGTFHVVFHLSDDPEELAANPLGLLLDEIHWARLSNLPERTTR